MVRMIIASDVIIIIIIVVVIDINVILRTSAISLGVTSLIFFDSIACFNNY